MRSRSVHLRPGSGELDTLIGKAQQTEKARVQLEKAHLELANVQNDRTVAEAELNRTKEARPETEELQRQAKQL